MVRGDSASVISLLSVGAACGIQGRGKVAPTRGSVQRAEKQALLFGAHRAVRLFFDADPVASRQLGLVELAVGALGPQQRGAADPLEREGTADADGDVEFDRWRDADRRALHRAADALGHHLAEAGLAGGQDHGEFLAAVARQGVHGPDAAAQRACDRLQDDVAGHVAVGVVDPLEVVDVEHQQQRRLARARDAVDLALEHGPEMPPVRQARERVLQRQFAETVDQALQVMPGRFPGDGGFGAQCLSDQGVRRRQAQVAQVHKWGGRGFRHKMQQTVFRKCISGCPAIGNYKGKRCNARRASASVR